MKTKQYVQCALFAAVTAALSQVAIPIGPVPINLATFSVFCSGIFLGARYGALSQMLYVLLGAIGLPVFSLFRGGLGMLVGPTGGFILGYIFAAGLIGFIVDNWGIGMRTLVFAMLSGAACYFSLGTVWYMYVMKSGLAEALLLCVVPFLVGDALKMVAAASVAKRLYPALRERRADMKSAPMTG